MATEENNSNIPPPASLTTPPAPEPNSFKMRLPAGIVTTNDVGHLAKEAEAVNDFLYQAAIRQPGSSLQLPKASKLFNEIVELNKLNMLHESDRKVLNQFLQALKNSAPVIHISFNTDPSPVFLNRLIAWIRQQMHPFVLLQVGLYPNIGAGCALRTTNKYYDFSLRTNFEKQRELLISKLRGSDVKETDDAPTNTAISVTESS